MVYDDFFEPVTRILILSARPIKKATRKTGDLCYWWRWREYEIRPCISPSGLHRKHAFKFVPDEFVEPEAVSLQHQIRQTKKPPRGWFCCLVEMAGIEPASASTPPSALHAYPIFRFNQQLPDRQGKLMAIPVIFSESTQDKLHRDLT